MAPFTESWTYLLTAEIIYGLCLLAATCVLGGHGWFWFEKRKKLLVLQKQNKPQSSARLIPARTRLFSSFDLEELVTAFHEKVHKNIMFYCTFLSLASFYGLSFMAFFYRLQDMRLLGNQNWCDDYFQTVTLLWGIGKYNMYMVFIARVHCAFENSAYDYSKKTIFGLYTFASAVYFAMFIAAPFIAGGKTRELKGKPPNDRMTICVSEVSNVLLVTGVVFDIVMSPLLVAMFVRPLRKLFRRRASQPTRRMSAQQIEMEMLPLKYTMSTSIAVISTLSSFVIMALTDATPLVVVDAIVNMICLVIVTAQWKPVYWPLCSPLLKAVAHFNCCFDDKLRADLNRVVRFYSAVAK